MTIHKHSLSCIEEIGGGKLICKKTREHREPTVLRTSAFSYEQPTSIFGGRQMFESFQIGDRVTIASGKWKGLEGHVTFLRSGPRADKILVLIDHPVHRMLGAVPLDPKNLQHGSQAMAK